MDDGFGVTFKKVKEDDCLEFLVEGLEPGIGYSFYIIAKNFNGEGERSDIAYIKSCVSPKQLKAPTLVQTTSTTATLRWTQPKDGGCPISSFNILSDEGVWSNPIDTAQDSANVEN